MFAASALFFYGIGGIGEATTMKVIASLIF
jgi:hypothetical protein